jgi:TolB-like protein/Flp pilus assembly protein TadD
MTTSSARALSARKLEQLSSKRIDLVRLHLEEVLASSAFAGSERAQDFLRLVVEHALQGDVDALRERMIGAEMFGRPVGYDTANDSVVRVKASEVRKKLAQYYFTCKGNPSVRIELPRGSYVPTFTFAPAAFKSVAQPAPASPVSTEQTTATDDDSAAPPNVPVAPRSAAKGFRRWVLPVAGGALGLVALGSVIGYQLLKGRHGDSEPPAEIRSIVVLPLENLSGDPRQDYFADGMTEELIADLGQVSALRVISRTSAMSYKGTKKNLPDIARELGVEAVVEGAVLRDGSQVRITAQLIDARTDHRVWSRTYARDTTSVLAMQGELAQAIADEVSINVTPQEQARLSRSRPVNPAAQDLYLQGKLRTNSGNFVDAIQFLQRAIEADPNSAQAHAALADCYGWMGESGLLPYTKAFSKQKSEAFRAIELDDSLAEGHIELANATMDLDWDWETADVEFRRAKELNPNSVLAHEKYAIYLGRIGRLSEAVAEANRGLELDPVSARSFRIAGFIYYFSRQYDQALALMGKAQALDVNVPENHFLLGDIYAERGKYAEAVAEFQKNGDNAHALGHLGNAYARAGQIDAAHKTISRLEEHVRRDGVGEYEIALVYAGLGDKSNAFKWLQSAYLAHSEGLTNLRIDPCLDVLRKDPRFANLMQRVGVTQDRTALTQRSR